MQAFLHVENDNQVKITKTVKNKLMKGDLYVEPQVVDGSVLLQLKPEHAVINNQNRAIINMWQQVKKNPFGILDILKNVDQFKTTADYYLLQLRKYNELLRDRKYDYETAALLIWLDQHSKEDVTAQVGELDLTWNGNTNKTKVDRQNLLDISKYLRNNNVDFWNLDLLSVFEAISNLNVEKIGVVNVDNLKTLLDQEEQNVKDDADNAENSMQGVGLAFDEAVDQIKAFATVIGE